MQMPHLARPPYAAVPAGPRPIAVGPDFHSGKKAREGRVMIGITVAILLALLATGARAGEQTKPFEGFTKYVKYHVRYEVNPDGTHVETHDWARKVLSDQGVSAANSASVSFSDRPQELEVVLPQSQGREARAGCDLDRRLWSARHRVDLRGLRGARRRLRCACTVEGGSHRPDQGPGQGGDETREDAARASEGALRMGRGKRQVRR